jgi:uncharacterized protein YndB with AHSA1/START domain
MKDLQLSEVPVAKAEMLIRKPARECFNAFVDPEVTTKFWFTKSNGKLEPGKQVKWEWEMYGISIPVNVKEVESDKRILIEWESGKEATTVEWVFTPLKDGTFVSVTNSGFSGDGDEVVKKALDSQGGFALVLAGAKAVLEHGINLNLIADRYPKGIAHHG